jgi:23S rRNA (uracil1939-C5)-methyltransferase
VGASTLRPVEVRIERLVAGGLGLAREESGRVVLVRGGLPGDVLAVEPTVARRDVVHAEIGRVVVAGPDRVEPPCPMVGAGCGGCDLQHAAAAAQPLLKAGIVVDALRRLGRIEDPVVRLGPGVPSTGYRTTVRCLVVDGSAAWRARASHDPVVVEHCLVAHPLIDELLVEGRFDGCREVTIRVGARTGERLVIAEPTAHGVRVPDGAVVVGTDELRRGRRAAFHEEVAGRRWRISARSFFQPSPEGAEALVAVAGELAAGALDRGPLVDLYGGVGLFAGTVGAQPRNRALEAGLVLVERSRSSAADARHNLGGLGARVRTMGVEEWRPEPASVVIADPSREGLGRQGVGAVSATGASRLVLVSCDPAAAGRDARLLVGEGWVPVESVVVDQFSMTSHVEVVSRFDRPA